MLCQSSLLNAVISLVYKDKCCDSYFLFHALPVFFIKYCHKLCIQRQMVVRLKHVSYLLYGNTWKRILLFPLHILYWIKLENFVMQLKRQSVEAWQNEKHYSKGNNISENPIPRKEILNQSTMWSTKVRSGHNICCLCSFFHELSSCRVTYENCYKSSGFLI